MRSSLKRILLAFFIFFSSTCAFSQSNDIGELLNKAADYLRKKDYSNAISYCNRVLSASPQNFEAFNIRGVAYLNAGSFGLAVTDFTSAINIHPDSVALYFNRGIAFYKNKQYDLAIVDFTKNMQANPGNTDVVNWLDVTYDTQAENLSVNGNYTGAIDNFNKAISISSTDVDAYTGIAHNYYLEDNYDEALEYYKKVIASNASNSSAHYGAGLAALRNGDYETAAAYFKKAIEIDPANGSALISLIAVLIAERKFDEASTYYQTYLINKPKSVFENNDSKYYLAFIHAAIEQAGKMRFAETLESIKKAEQQYSNYNIKNKTLNSLKHRYADMLAFRGYVEEKLGRTYDAKNTYKLALNLNPNQPDVKEAIDKLNTITPQPSVKNQAPPTINLLMPPAADSALLAADSTRQIRPHHLIVNNFGQNTQTQLVGTVTSAVGISEIKVNDRPVANIEDKGLFSSMIDINDGTNNITVEVTDKNNKKTKKTYVIVVDKKGSGTPLDSAGNAIKVVSISKQTFHAIIIGEQAYQYMHPLAHPVEDAKSFAAILQDQYTFKPDYIDTLYDRSREDILEAIYNLCDSLTENDNLLIFYAGHGDVYPEGSKTGYLLPVSARTGIKSSYISMSDISDALKNCQAKHVLFIADACYSGALVRHGFADDAVSQDINDAIANASRRAITSGNLTAVPDNSLFIKVIKEKLQANTKSFFTAKELFKSIRDAFISNVEYQKIEPQYGSILDVGDFGGDFVFVKKP